MIPSVSRGTASAALVLGALSGCGGPKCPAQLLTDPAQALASRHYAPEAITSLRAEAKVDQRGKAGRVKGTVLMFVQRPDRVRFDVMTQFGPVLILSSDGESFALSDFKENRFLAGPACEENIARLVGVAISGEAVASVLMGDVPAIDASQDAVSCSGEGGYRIERRAEGGALQTIELAVHSVDMQKPPAQQRSELREVSYTNAAGKRLYRVRYEDYRAVGKQGVRLPFTVRIEDSASQFDALLRFESIDLNVRVPDEAFAQKPRPGLRIEAVSCE
jgi:outer membrane lipoprotein-sorting protein